MLHFLLLYFGSVFFLNWWLYFSSVGLQTSSPRWGDWSDWSGCSVSCGVELWSGLWGNIGTCCNFMGTPWRFPKSETFCFCLSKSQDWISLHRSSLVDLVRRESRLSSSSCLERFMISISSQVAESHFADEGSQLLPGHALKHFAKNVAPCAGWKSWRTIVVRSTRPSLDWTE